MHAYTNTSFHPALQVHEFLLKRLHLLQNEQEASDICDDDSWDFSFVLQGQLPAAFDRLGQKRKEELARDLTNWQVWGLGVGGWGLGVGG